MLISGLTMRFSRRTNITINKEPTIMGSHTATWVTPKLLALLNPKSKPTKPIPQVMNDGASKRSCLLPPCERAHFIVGTIMATMKPNINQKKLFHPNALSSAPPIVGPKFTMKPMATPLIPMNSPMRSRGISTITIVCMAGIIRPAPAACITRAISATGNSGTAITRSEPAAIQPSATIIMNRSEKRFVKNGARGTKTPSAKM